MKTSFKNKVVAIADWLTENKGTVRQAADLFAVSKSSVHKYMTVYLAQIDTQRAKKVAQLFAANLAERHLRGGEATKQKYRRT